MTNAENPSYSCICGIAQSQGGFVARSQLGSRGTIESWVRTGRLIRAWSGVFAVGHMPTEPRARAFGAMLAAGDDAALGGWSAAAFYGAAKRWPQTFEFVSTRRSRVNGITVHVARSLILRDVWRFDGLRVTSPARTALDLAPGLASDRLHAIVDRLRLDRRLSLEQITDVIARNPRHPGARPLAGLIGRAGRRPSRSALERRWRIFARAAGIGPYETNTRVGAFEADVLIDGVLIVEIDTFASHLLNFESDRRRDAEILARTGIPTIRITDTQIDSAPAATAARIVTVLAALRAAPRSD